MSIISICLDMKVSLVAILDADKEGFLRSDTSLIQTIGRVCSKLPPSARTRTQQQTRTHAYTLMLANAQHDQWDIHDRNLVAGTHNSLRNAQSNSRTT